MNDDEIIYLNYDTPPKFLGIFSYSNLIITLAIIIPLIYLICHLDISISNKIYIAFILIFPALVINIVFAEFSQLHKYIWCIIIYFFSPKEYIYSFEEKKPVFSSFLHRLYKRIKFPLHILIHK